MKVAKTNEQEILRLTHLLGEIESLSEELDGCRRLEDIDFEDKEILSKFDKNSPSEFLKELCHEIRTIHFQRILLNCSTLLENCADPNLKYLDFNPKIKAGLELLEKQSTARTFRNVYEDKEFGGVRFSGEYSSYEEAYDLRGAFGYLYTVEVIKEKK